MKKTMLLVLVLLLGLATEVADADFIFSTPTNLGPTVNSISNEQAPSISADGLELYFSEYQGAPYRAGGQGRSDIWVTTRQTKDDPWGVPVNLGSVVNSSAKDEHPSISDDGLSLYFGSNRSGGAGSEDLWVTTRETKDSPWGEPVNLGSTVNSKYPDWEPDISANGLSLYFSDYLSPRPGGHGEWDIYVATRSTLSEPWSDPVNIGPTANSSGLDAGPNISVDGLTMFLSSARSGGFGGADIWMTTRKTQNDDWELPVNLGSMVNKSGFDAMPSISSDGSTLYFCSERSGGSGNVDLWQASIEPIVDLNGDEVIDVQDLIIMTQYWGENYPLCDIGPMPWGDGIVDVYDLMVLTKYVSPTPVAHWALDETEGMFAADSVGDNDAFVVGGATWQSSGGRVDGALELNGVDGCAILSPVLNPADGPFSIFAWIKGGAPGQIIISQQATADWLAVDAEGNLMTELKSSDQLADPLHSETVITDGQWRRIGLVWDGSHRTLFVDGAKVAEDTQPDLEGSQMGLYIGVGKNYAGDTFFSGLIDDVRIYNKTLSLAQIMGLAQ